MSTSPAPVAPAETAPLSEGARILNIFIAPTKTVADDVFLWCSLRTLRFEGPSPGKTLNHRSDVGTNGSE